MMTPTVHFIAAVSCAVLLTGCNWKNPQSDMPPHSLSPAPTIHGITPHRIRTSDHFEMTNVSATTEGHAALYDIAYDRAPLLAIVREFSQLEDASIVAVPDELIGTASVRLTGVEWKPALQAILHMHDLQLVERIPGTGVYSVTKRVPGGPDPVLAQVILFDTSDEAVEVAKAIQTVWSTHDSVYVAAVPSYSAVVLRAREPVIGEVQFCLKLMRRDEKRNEVPTTDSTLSTEGAPSVDK